MADYKVEHELHEAMKQEGLVTWSGLAQVVPLAVLLISGVSAFFSLQVQITELKTKYDTEVIQLRGVILELRDDVKALRELRETDRERK